MKSWYFSPALYWNQQSFFFLFLGNVCIHSKRMLFKTCVFIASVQGYAVWTGLLKVSRAYAEWQYFKTTFGWSAGKNNPDFVQLLMVFHYSNIYYSGCISIFRFGVLFRLKASQMGHFVMVSLWWTPTSTSSRFCFLYLRKNNSAFDVLSRKREKKNHLFLDENYLTYTNTQKLHSS